jgi:uncharacterized Zn finger protein
MWWREFPRFPKSQPKRVAGGIKAQSRGGSFGKSWWAKRWIEVLDSFNLGARLTRGRSYARQGQVISINVGDGVVSAKVQGSRPTPYDITIRVNRLSDADWEKVIERLNEQAVFAAKLLGGEMPHEIESVFVECGTSLFPNRVDDLATDCSCPDWSNPCKHIAAVYYLIGEEFDRDPFLMFRLRGKRREELLKHLHAHPASEAAPAAVAAEPLGAEAKAFWDLALPADLVGDTTAPPVAAAALRRLGKFPYWRGDRPLGDALQSVYINTREAGIRAVLGERQSDEAGADVTPVRASRRRAVLQS